jgi:heme-degrading monooxygenase HmoA
MTSTPVLQRHAAFSVLPLLAVAAASPAAEAAALDDPNSVITVMQYSARSEVTRAELKLRMAAMRDHLRAKPGLVENALFENRNATTKHHDVGVSRWKSSKDRESLWLDAKTQALVARIGEVGDFEPGTFGVVK